MIMEKFLVRVAVVITVLVGFFPYAALSQMRFIHKVEVPVKFGITDKLQNVYILTPDEEIIKYDPRGKELGRYTNNYMGDATLIDPTNPINTLVYYPDLQTFVTLDVTVNEISRTNLVSFGYFNIPVICSTNDGNVWMVDLMEFRLKKINRNGRILATSEDLMLLFGSTPGIIQLWERDNQVYALDPDRGIFVFDNFANFDRKIEISNTQYFQIFGDKIFYLQNNSAYFFDLRMMTTSPLRLPSEDLNDLLFFNMHVDKCYLFREGGFEVWRY
jgi:hypothetical protein